MSPLPRSRVIHPRWAEHHAGVVRGTMTATCVITSGSTGGWDPVSGPSAPGAGTTIYSGPCRVLNVTAQPRQDDAAGQVTAEHPYLVSLPPDAAEVPVHAQVRITSCPDDVQLVSKVLTVADVAYGSLRWERTLVCDLDLANQEV